jgi:hypothetical protein
VKIILLCCALFSLSGCAPTFVKSGATAQDIAQDKYGCHRDVAQSQLSGTIAGQGLYQECMRAHGYTQMCGAKECPAWSLPRN